ncbi:MAG: DUF1573 domain-containing protein, partial [Phycisphaerae bacterium]
MQIAGKKRVSASGRFPSACVGLAVLSLAANAWAQAAAPAPNPVPVPAPVQANLVTPATQPTMAPSGKFRCDQTTFDAGEVWQGDTIQATFVIHNDGDTPLQIPSVQASCGCTATDWDKVIEPGKEGKVRAQVRTTGLPAADTVKTVTVKTSDPKNPSPVLQIKGRIKHRVVIEPPGGIVFGRIDLNSPSQTRTVTITNNTTTPLKLEKLPTRPGGPFTAELKAIEEGKKYELTVTAETAKLREGMNNEPISLKSGLVPEADVIVQVSATKPRLIEITPTEVVAVPVPTDAEVKKEFFITYNGTGQLQFQGEPESNDAAIKVALIEAAPPPPVVPAVPPPQPPPPPKVEPGKSYKVTVTIPPGYDPPLPITTYPTIKLKTNVAERPEIQLRVQAYPRPPSGPAVVAESLIGKPAPQVTIKDANGKDFEIGKTNGRVNVITFWASWCGFCKRFLPILQQISPTYTSKGVDFKLVSLDQSATTEQIVKVAKDLGVTLPTGIDPRQASGHKYGATGFPISFILGKDGTVQAVHRGAVAIEKITSQLDLLLAGKTYKDFPT